MTQFQTDVKGRQIPPTLARGTTGATGLNALSFENVAAMRAGDFSGSLDGDTVKLRGYWTENDGGGGDLFIDATDTTTADDGGFTFVTTGVQTLRLKRLLEGYVSPEMTGARIDYNVTDDTDAWNNLLTYINDPTKNLPKKILQPPGWSMINGTLIPQGHDITWEGAGIGVSGIRLMDNSDLIPAGAAPDNTKVRMISNLSVATEPVSDFHIRKLTIDGNLDNQNQDAGGFVRRTLEGISMACHGSSCRQVEIQHVGPNNDTTSECFAVIMYPGAVGTITTAPANTDTPDISAYNENIIEDCVMTEWPLLATIGKTGGNVYTCFLAMNSGVDAGTGNSDVSVSGRVKDCFVTCPTDYLDTVRVFGSTANLVTANVFENVSHGCRIDSWRLSNILVQDNSLINCGSIATFNTNGAGFTQLSNITVKNNTITQWLDAWEGNSNRAVQVFADDNDDQHHWIENVLIENNYILSKEAGAAAIWGIYVVQEGFTGTDAFLDDVVVRNNIIHYEGSGSRLIVTSDVYPIPDDIRFYENRDQNGDLIVPNDSTAQNTSLYTYRNHGPFVWKIDAAHTNRFGQVDFSRFSGQYPRTHIFHFEETADASNYLIQLDDTFYIENGDQLAVVVYKPATNPAKTVVVIEDGVGANLRVINTDDEVCAVGLYQYSSGTGLFTEVAGSYREFASMPDATRYIYDTDLYETPNTLDIKPEYPSEKVLNLATMRAWKASTVSDDVDSWVPEAAGLVGDREVMWVDTNGVNANARMGDPDRPYATITAALASSAAVSGQVLIIVMPGVYDEAFTLINGTDIYFMPGATSRYTGGAAAIIIDGGGGVSCNISGHLEITRTFAGAADFVFDLSGSGSFNIELLSITVVGASQGAEICSFGGSTDVNFKAKFVGGPSFEGGGSDFCFDVDTSGTVFIDVDEIITAVAQPAIVISADGSADIVLNFQRAIGIINQSGGGSGNYRIVGRYLDGGGDSAYQGNVGCDTTIEIDFITNDGSTNLIDITAGSAGKKFVIKNSMLKTSNALGIHSNADASPADYYLFNSYIVANTESISAATAATVWVIANSAANVAVDGNITEHVGTLLVSANLDY